MSEAFDNAEANAAAKQLLERWHPLRYVFFELTSSCNLRCRHCGSRCPGGAAGETIPAAAFRRVVDRIAGSYPKNQLMFCITGGEPLLNPDWFDVCSHIAERGFSWGMTTNGTLIDAECVEKLSRAGMKTVAVSLDGLRESHEALRGVEGSFDGAVNALRLLVQSGNFRAVQVVTVVNRLNLEELPRLYELVCSLGVASWKLTPIEPIGDARAHPELFLDEHEHYRLLNFILQHRRKAAFEITYGCSHNLPKRYEEKVRARSFLCGAGTMIASVASNGDILPCLDIDCREKVRQGNVLRDDFVEVWEKGFTLFRANKALGSPFCRDCPQRQECRGDSWHSWDVEENAPRVCLKNHRVFS